MTPNDDVQGFVQQPPLHLVRPRYLRLEPGLTKGLYDCFSNRRDAFKNGQRIGYFDHDLKCLVLDGDKFINRQTWKGWRAFTKAHQGENISQFLFQCIGDLKADGNKKGSIKVPYERLRARLKLRKIGLTNDWTPYASRTLAYLAEFDRRYKDKHFDLLQFFTYPLYVVALVLAAARVCFVT